MSTGARNFTPEYIAGCLEGSLKRLGMDVIDYYQLHNPNVDNMAAEGQLRAAREGEGTTGRSSTGASRSTRSRSATSPPSKTSPPPCRLEYNVISQEAAPAFARAKAANVGVISRVPLKRGFLSGRIDEAFEFAEGRP